MKESPDKFQKCPVCGKKADFIRMSGKFVYQLCPLCFNFVAASEKEVFGWNAAKKFMPQYFK